MSETEVPRGGRVRLGVVDGDLRVGSGARIDADGRLAVSGDIRFDGSSKVEGTVECGSMDVEDGTVEIHGDVTIRERLRAHDGGVEISGALTAREVDVDRRLRIGVRPPPRSSKSAGSWKAEARSTRRASRSGESSVSRAS